MNAITRLASATRLAASTFTAWRLLDSGKAQPHPLDGDTLAEVEREIAYEALFGATLFVRETDTLSGRSTVHAYRIRRGSKAIGWAGGRKLYAYDAHKLFAVEAAFSPVEPWKHSPGCDVIGLTGIIEGARA